jgi:hypothetical protein
MTPPTEFSGVSTPRYFTSAHSYIIRDTCPEDDGLNETNYQHFNYKSKCKRMRSTGREEYDKMMVKKKEKERAYPL